MLALTFPVPILVATFVIEPKTLEVVKAVMVEEYET
jgi:hypothetical protein